MLLERLAKSCMGIIAGGQGDLGDIHGTSAQFPAGPLEAHPADISGRILARVPCEYPVEVWNGNTREPGEDHAVERFAEVLANISLNGFYFVGLGFQVQHNGYQ